MRAVRARNTSPEMALRRSLRAQGFRGYRVSPRQVRGAPDVTYLGLRLAVFVDGCYWHGCPQHCRKPSSNTEYWHTKIARNIERDQAATEALRQEGWTVLRIWEHELRHDAKPAAQRVIDTVAMLRLRRRKDRRGERA